MKRHKMPTNRNGETHDIQCGEVTLSVTVNRDATGIVREMFVKASNGWQGWADALAVTASLAMQHGCAFERIMAKWRGMRFPPDGIGAFSVPDAIARRFESTATTTRDGRGEE